MLAQISPEILKSLPDLGLGEGFLFAAFSLYGAYLLVHRYLAQQEKDRNQLLAMIISQIEETKKESEALRAQVQALQTTQVKIVERLSRLVSGKRITVRKIECVSEQIAKLREEFK
jgi:septal ring factor EnvC (AmiA/AmiB activator)